MLNHRTKSNQALCSFTTALLTAIATSGAAYADGLLSPDHISFFEEPLAIEFGATTLSLQGSAHQFAVFNKHHDDAKYRSKSDVTLRSETKLQNQLTFAATYWGQYDSRRGSISDVGGGGNNDDYQDNVYASLGGVWGTIVGGNTFDLVGRNHIRRSQVGNADLAFDTSFGSLDEWGGGYYGRYGFATIAVMVDEHGHFDSGLRVARPLGNKDVGFALRGNHAEFLSQDMTNTFDTTGISASADVIYGSSLFDITIGYEDFSSAASDVDRIYAAFGVQHKVGALTLSAQGQIGSLDGNEERAWALGLQYDFARGLSGNIGINYAKLYAMHNGIVLVDKDAMETVFSLKYSY